MVGRQKVSDAGAWSWPTCVTYTCEDEFLVTVCATEGSGSARKTCALPDVSLKGSLWQHLMENNMQFPANVHMWPHKWVPPHAPNIYHPAHVVFCYANCSDSIFKGYNWTITIVFSKSSPSLQTVILHLFQVIRVDLKNFIHKTRVQYK